MLNNKRCFEHKKTEKTCRERERERERESEQLQTIGSFSKSEIIFNNYSYIDRRIRDTDTDRV